jgi:hypothetical protein
MGTVLKRFSWEPFHNNMGIIVSAAHFPDFLLGCFGKQAAQRGVEPARGGAVILVGDQALGDRHLQAPRR